MEKAEERIEHPSVDIHPGDGVILPNGAHAVVQCVAHMGEPGAAETRYYVEPCKRGWFYWGDQLRLAKSKKAK